jgi:hypothetical protein
MSGAPKAVSGPLFLYLRLRAGSAAGSAPLDGVSALAPGSCSRLQVGTGRGAWEDGCVIRLETGQRPAELAKTLSRELAECMAWTIHDGEGAFVESGASGAMRRYFETLRVFAIPQRRFAQLFAAVTPGDRDPARTIDGLRARMSGCCIPVFRFADGAVMLLDSRESGAAITRRCADLTPQLRFWAVAAADGDAYSLGAEGPIWQAARPIAAESAARAG